ncbi:MAG: hypothetical protein JWM16_3436, partial [Verrucomicrobiales bacterium]|nr:hypothetical protein [Verrucomicrobiales bacterium]
MISFAGSVKAALINGFRSEEMTWGIPTGAGGGVVADDWTAMPFVSLVSSTFGRMVVAEGA